ncbi:MAG: dockerin type I domain-containing protein [Clostridia bacterium]
MKTIMKTIALMLVLLIAFPSVLVNATDEKALNEHDVAVVRNFLEQETNGVKNGIVMFGEKYEADSPDTWVVDTTKLPGYSWPASGALGFCFNSDQSLLSVRFAYWYHEKIGDMEVDGISYIPVEGELILNDCENLTYVETNNAFTTLSISNPSPDFRCFELGTHESMNVFLPMPFGISYVSFTSEYPAITAYGHRKLQDSIENITAVALPYVGEESNIFVGWFDRLTGELYSNDEKIFFSVENLGVNFTCALEARYLNSAAFVPETDDAWLPSGDANNNHSVTTGDASSILMANVNNAPSSYQPLLSDVNRDGLVNTGDAAILLSFFSLDNPTHHIGGI